jgi:hypothetical protein
MTPIKWNTLRTLILVVALVLSVSGAEQRLAAQDNGQQGDQTQTGQSGQSGQTGQTGQTDDNNTTQKKKKGGGLFGGLKKMTGGQSGDETTTTASAGGKAIGEGKAIGDVQPTAADRAAVQAMERYALAADALKKFQSDGKLQPQK